MELFYTNAGLGYREYAVLAKLKEDNKYIVLDNDNMSEYAKEDYLIGSTQELEELYLEDSDMDVKETEGYKFIERYEELAKLLISHKILPKEQKASDTLIPKWVSVKDNLPTVYVDHEANSDEFSDDYAVLVYTKDGKQKIASLEQWDCDNEDEPVWYEQSSEHWNIDDDVAFWMPLLKAPICENNNEQEEKLSSTKIVDTDENSSQQKYQ